MQPDSEFRPGWWCRSPHAQTLRPFLFKPGLHVEYGRVRLELEDGDFIDIDRPVDETHDPSPILLIVHGLGGSSRSHYVHRLVRAGAAAGWRSAIMHHRGCSGEPNRLPRSYHAGDGGDINAVLRWLRQTEPNAPLFAAGYSLGGSMLLHQLTGYPERVRAAAVVSTPLDLSAGAARMERGFSRIYQQHLVSCMKSLIRQKFDLVDLPFGSNDLQKVRTFREFDDLVTAPLHGFSGADDYYARCSPRRLLRATQTPTLVIHAADDPLTSREVIPGRSELSQSIDFRLSEHGGHCGFVGGNLPLRPIYWAEQQMVEFFRTFLPADG